MAGWAPETDLAPLKVDDEIGSHVLVGETGLVRAIPASESWPEREVKSILQGFRVKTQSEVLERCGTGLG